MECHKLRCLHKLKCLPCTHAGVLCMAFEVTGGNVVLVMLCGINKAIDMHARCTTEVCVETCRGTTHAVQSPEDGLGTLAHRHTIRTSQRMPWRSKRPFDTYCPGIPAGGCGDGERSVPAWSCTSSMAMPTWHIWPRCCPPILPKRPKLLS